MKRSELNAIKTNVINGYRYCQSVYNGGIASVEQFNTFKHLCHNLVDSCNFWCNTVKPVFGWLQYNKMKQYNELYFLCDNIVRSMGNMIAEFQTMLDKQAEEAEAITLIEKRVRAEHAIALELRENQLQIAKSNPIGYCITDTK